MKVSAYLLRSGRPGTEIELAKIELTLPFTITGEFKSESEAEYSLFKYYNSIAEGVLTRNTMLQ